VVPTVMALRLHTGLARQLGHALLVGVIAVVAGCGLSYALDLPTGAVIVCVYGVLLVLQVAGEAVARRGRAA
jgi:ABC-type Mn2+/Zn2+ transport system permease subunit